MRKRHRQHRALLSPPPYRNDDAHAPVHDLAIRHAPPPPQQLLDDPGQLGEPRHPGFTLAAVASARRGRHIRGGLHPLHDLRPRSRRPGPPVTGSSGGRSCEHGRRTTWPQHQPHLELDQGIRAAQRMVRGALRRHRCPSRHRPEPVVGPAVKGGRSTRPAPSGNGPTPCRSQPRGADHTAAGPGASQFPRPPQDVGNLQNLHELGLSEANMPRPLKRRHSQVGWLSGEPKPID